MTKIIELAHKLGEEIAKSDEIANLEAAKGDFQSDKELQDKIDGYNKQYMDKKDEIGRINQDINRYTELADGAPQAVRDGYLSTIKNLRAEIRTIQDTQRNILDARDKVQAELDALVLSSQLNVTK